MNTKIKPSFITFAITAGKTLKIKYKKQNKLEQRNIKPVNLKVAKNGNVILVAFDRDKLRWRSFIIDKINYVKINERALA